MGGRLRRWRFIYSKMRSRRRLRRFRFSERGHPFWGLYEKWHTRMFIGRQGYTGGYFDSKKAEQKKNNSWQLSHPSSCKVQLTSQRNAILPFSIRIWIIKNERIVVRATCNRDYLDSILVEAFLVQSKRLVEGAAFLEQCTLYLACPCSGIDPGSINVRTGELLTGERSSYQFPNTPTSSPRVMTKYSGRRAWVSGGMISSG